MTPGQLILKIVSALDTQGIPTVYLRNYEKLPDEIGNDVDLLVAPGARMRAAQVAIAEAQRYDWVFLGMTHFSPLAVYFANLATTETLHIDLFDRLEWHFVELADAEAILARRRQHSQVFVPAAADEIYLNLVTRLAYQGLVRDKHRLAARDFVAAHGDDALRETFVTHLDADGIKLYHCLSGRDWRPTPGDRKLLLSLILRTHGVSQPHRLAAGIGRYVLRTFRKLTRPPGRLIVLEGADGVGKSTVLGEVRSWCSKWNAGRECYGFHWKPVSVAATSAPMTAPVDPRGKQVRPWYLSLVFLAYHLAGYWWGWGLRVYPLLTKAHAVVGDRYSFDLFLDPARFRLGLPPWICRVAAFAAPRPTLAVALVAEPRRVHARKPELSIEEIARYQDRWQFLAAGRPRMLTVSADGAPDEVVLAVKQAILKSLATHGIPRP